MLLSDLIASSPDLHLLCFLDQIITEIRMCDGDDGFSSLPGIQTLQVHHSVLGNEILRVGSGICNDGTLCQSGDDIVDLVNFRSDF